MTEATSSLTRADPQKVIKLAIVEMNAASDHIVWLFELFNCFSRRSALHRFYVRLCLAFVQYADRHTT